MDISKSIGGVRVKKKSGVDGFVVALILLLIGFGLCLIFKDEITSWLTAMFGALSGNAGNVYK